MEKNINETQCQKDLQIPTPTKTKDTKIKSPAKLKTSMLVTPPVEVEIENKRVISEIEVLEDFTDSKFTKGQLLFCELMSENEDKAKAYSYAMGRYKDWDPVGNPTEVYYCRRRANELLKLPAIVNKIKEFRVVVEQRMKDEFKLDQNYVLDGLRKVYEECMLPKEQSNGTYKIDASGANKALELLGKTMGMFTDGSKANINAVQINVRLTDGQRVEANVVNTIDSDWLNMVSERKQSR